MAFDIGSFFGGGLSGAAAGATFGPWGAVAGGLLGGIGGGVAGGSTPELELSPMQQELANYGYSQVKAPPSRKKEIISTFKRLKKEGNRGAAEAHLAQYLDRFSNPEFIEKRLAKSQRKRIDYNAAPYADIAKDIFGQQGLGFTQDEYRGFGSKAKALGIRSPVAFGDMLKQQLMASGKVPTAAQEQLALIFGPSARDESGRITNLYRPIAKVNPDELMKQIQGNLPQRSNEYTFNVNYNNTSNA